MLLSSGAENGTLQIDLMDKQQVQYAFGPILNNWSNNLRIVLTGCKNIYENAFDQNIEIVTNLAENLNLVTGEIYLNYTDGFFGLRSLSEPVLSQPDFLSGIRQVYEKIYYPISSSHYKQKEKNLNQGYRFVINKNSIKTYRDNYFSAEAGGDLIADNLKSEFEFKNSQVSLDNMVEDCVKVYIGLKKEKNNEVLHQCLDTVTWDNYKLFDSKDLNPYEVKLKFLDRLIVLDPFEITNNLLRYTYTEAIASDYLKNNQREKAERQYLKGLAKLNQNNQIFKTNNPEFFFQAAGEIHVFTLKNFSEHIFRTLNYLSEGYDVMDALSSKQLENLKHNDRFKDAIRFYNVVILHDLLKSLKNGKIKPEYFDRIKDLSEKNKYWKEKLFSN